MAQQTKDTFGDDRLKKDAGSSVRGSRDGADEARQNDGTALTSAQRSRMLREQWAHEILPTPPDMPGYHLCWLSTTNGSDPIFKRVQLGYTPVKASEVPGFVQTRVDAGEFEGCVSCNEMLLFKIPSEVYQEIMLVNHYERPNEEEEVLRANAKVDGQDNDGRELGQMEGFDTLNKRVRTPTFA